MRVEVIVPWRGGCPHREAALSWLRSRSDHELTIAPGGDPWIKSLAVWPAVKRSWADIIVLHDADVWTDGLDEAIQAVQAGASWAVPHREVHRFSETATNALLLGHEHPRDLDRPAYVGMLGGGIVVARREVFLDIPFDPRFTGWGQEDMALGVVLQTMHGRAWRGEAPLIHLWHPLAPRITRKWGSDANRLLYERYHVAIGNRSRMTILLKEAHDALRALEQEDHHHQAIGVG